MENKSVKDQRPDFKENDMRDHLSGCNDEDGDHLKLDIERLDEEEDQGPNKENEQNDVPNQVPNQVTGVNMMTVTARSMAGTVKMRFHIQRTMTTKLLGWRPNTQLMRNPIAKLMGMNMMFTARSMAPSLQERT